MRLLIFLQNLRCSCLRLALVYRFVVPDKAVAQSIPTNCSPELSSFLNRRDASPSSLLAEFVSLENHILALARIPVNLSSSTSATRTIKVQSTIIKNNRPRSAITSQSLVSPSPPRPFPKLPPSIRWRLFARITFILSFKYGSWMPGYPAWIRRHAGCLHTIPACCTNLYLPNGLPDRAIDFHVSFCGSRDTF